MRLRNNFRAEDIYRVWGDTLWCHLCGSNNMTSVHHIDSRSSSSVYNSIPLCHTCHRTADSHNTNSPLSTEYRNKLREIAYNRVVKSGHINTDNDIDYLHKTRTS